MLPNEERYSLSKYRIEKAKTNLQAAKVLIDTKLYADSANRSYYAIFHSINALFALEGVAFKKHSGVISHFNLKYIKTGIFEKEMSKIAGEAFQIRSDSDYEDFYIVSYEEVTEQYNNAVRFVEAIEEYILKTTK